MLLYDCASIAVEGLYLGDNPLHRDHLWKHFSLNISDILSSFYCFDTSALLTNEIITVFIYPSLLMVGLHEETICGYVCDIISPDGDVIMILYNDSK